MRFIWVGVGGAVGSMLRYGVGLWFSNARFPWATLSVNIVGSFALGVLLTYALGRWSTTITSGLAVGLIGGFTTFSTFAWESFTMTQAGEVGRATLYLVVSLVGGLLAALLGYATGRALG
jgi:fluoride exporter